MARQPVWHDNYWLLLVQLYLRKPVGVKRLYSRELVELAMELHVHPQYLHRMMEKLDTAPVPSLKTMLDRYSNNSRRLAREVERLRGMSGFGDPESFYDGVEVNEGFERRFKPISGHEPLSEVMLVLLLDLYYRLTPQTMVEETPEVAEMAMMLRIPVALVVEALNAYCMCDPCLRARGGEGNNLLTPCREVWEEYADVNPNELARMASELKEYYK